MHPLPPTCRRCAPRRRKAGMSCRSLLFRSGNFAVKSPSRSALSTPQPDARTTNSKSRVSIPIPAQNVPTRSIILLAGAGFASQAMVRGTDSLLPQIAADFRTTGGAASIVVAAYAVGHGSGPLLIGPIGGRLGQYRPRAVMCALPTVLG